MNSEDSALHYTYPPKGIVYLVGAGPGDPGLLSLKGRACLEQAQVVVHDRLVHPLLLTLPIQAELINVGKRPDFHRVPQEEINQLLIRHGGSGKIVVRLKGGDPFVFGRGGEEAAALAEAGVPFEIVPGVTSPVAGPAYAGIPVTHRETARSVAFITGHLVEDEDPLPSWRQSAQSADTLIFLMGVRNLPLIVKAMIEGGRSPSTPVAILRRATLPDQTIIKGTLQTIDEHAEGIEPPALIIIGDVVALSDQLGWREREPKKPLENLQISLLGDGPVAFDLGLALFNLGAEIVPAKAGTHEASHGALVLNNGLENARPDWLERFSSTGKLIAVSPNAQRALAQMDLQAELVPETAPIDLLIEKVTRWREP